MLSLGEWKGGRTVNSLAMEFEQRLRGSIQASIELGYHPTRFAEMLNTFDGVTMAKRLVRSDEIQDGLRRIVELGHPELAMESIMLEPQFATLFTPDDLAAARWRLNQVS
jgi:hypothetical protein